MLILRKHILLLPLPVVLLACGDADDANRVVGQLASDRIELAAEVSEPILEIRVVEGAQVAAGDILLRQDDARASARLAEADAAHRQAQARLDELVRGPRSEQIAAARANLDGAQRDLEFRDADYERTRDVHSQKLASEESLDQARARLDAARATLALRRAQLEELLAGTTMEELAQAENSVKQAAARLELARIDLQRHTIRAPIDGITDTRLFESGERPSPGQPVMIMLAGKQPYARVYVPENLRVHVQAGTEARIHVDGLDEAIAGRVRWVSSDTSFTPYFALTERDRRRLSYVAKVDIDDDRSRLPDGVPVEVELLIETESGGP